MMATNESNVRFVYDGDSGMCDLAATKEPAGVFPSDEIRGIVMGFSQGLREKYCEGKEPSGELFDAAQNIAICCDPTVPNVQPPEMTFDLVSGMLGMGIFGNEEYRDMLRKFWALLCYYRDKLAKSAAAGREDFMLFINMENCFIHELSLYKEQQNNLAMQNLCAHARRLDCIIDQLQEKLQNRPEASPSVNDLAGIRAKLDEYMQATQRELAEVKQTSTRNLEVTEKLYGQVTADLEEDSRKEHLPIPVAEAAQVYGVCPRTINKWDKHRETRPDYYVGRDINRKALKLLVFAHWQKVHKSKQERFDEDMLPMDPALIEQIVAADSDTDAIDGKNDE